MYIYAAQHTRQTPVATAFLANIVSKQGTICK